VIQFVRTAPLETQFLDATVKLEQLRGEVIAEDIVTSGSPGADVQNPVRVAAR